MNSTEQAGSTRSTRSSRSTRSGRLEIPSREAIEELEPFGRIELDRIQVVTDAAEVDAAYADLVAQPHVGFDTESKPTFLRGEQSDGPHVVQFATLQRAYIFQLHVAQANAAVMALLASKTMTKIGFGLDSDKTQIRAKLQVEPRALLDMDAVFREYGYRKSVGLKSAIAIVFHQRFAKSKRIGTSDWSSQRLNERQLLYAANDAYAAIQVFKALVDAQARPPGAVTRPDR